MTFTTFKPKRPARKRKDRGDEFVSFTPRPRTLAALRSPMMTQFLEYAGPERPLPKTRGTKQAEKDYMGRVAALGCVVCRLLGHGASPAQVHHVRAGQGKGQRSGSYCTVPLCLDHHTGPRGVHGDRACLRQLNVDELDLLDITIGELV